MTIDRLPGFREFYPESCLKRNFLFRKWNERARAHDFEEYDIPTLEPLELFTEKSGEEIVEQLFHFEDKGGRAVALRPELTPSLARMIGAKANSLKRPVKWFNIAENFRYERQQKGRLRSHYQFNADIFGEASESADAEVMVLALESLRSFGLAVEDMICRVSDRQLWIYFLEGLGCGGEQASEVLGIVDKMERMPREAVMEKLSPRFGDSSADVLAAVEMLTSIRSVDELGTFLEGQTNHADLKSRIRERISRLGGLMEILRGYGCGEFVRTDLGIVRGLAYYTGFVWEIFSLDGAGELSGRALAGGGRYDHLIEKLGFPPLPAVGFGMGDVTLLDLLEERGKLPDLVDGPEIVVVCGGESERESALWAVANLRRRGWRVRMPLRLAGFSKQFKQAGASGARFCLIFGSEEVQNGQARVRDLESGKEQLVPSPALTVEMERIAEEGIYE